MCSLPCRLLLRPENIILDRLKGFRADVVLDPAGVRGGYLRIDAQLDEPLADEGMALVGCGGQRQAVSGQIYIPLFRDHYVAAVL